MIEINKIHNENCLDTMSRMPNHFVDLTVTSPPYDNLRTYNGYEFDFEAIARELYRVTKIGGIVVWIVGDATIDGSETGTSFRHALFFKEIGFNLHDTMIYQKNNPPPIGGDTRYFQHFEFMFVFAKGGVQKFNPIIMDRRNKWNDKRTHRKKAFNRDTQGNFTKKEITISENVKIGNVWKYVVGGGNSVGYGIKHPAAFPEKLAHDHIVSWSKKGDLVYDPMSGSGTTVKMAILNDRNWIGSETSKEYCEIIEERIRPHIEQGRMF